MFHVISSILVWLRFYIRLCFSSTFLPFSVTFIIISFPITFLALLFRFPFPSRIMSPISSRLFCVTLEITLPLVTCFIPKPSQENGFSHILRNCGNFWYKCDSVDHCWYYCSPSCWEPNWQQIKRIKQYICCNSCCVYVYNKILAFSQFQHFPVTTYYVILPVHSRIWCKLSIFLIHAYMKVTTSRRLNGSTTSFFINTLQCPRHNVPRLCFITATYLHFTMKPL